MAKLLLSSDVDPWLLAGLFYIASGLGLAVVLYIRRALGFRPVEAPLGLIDVPWLALAVLAGGVMAPVLLMFGLQGTDASTASLLLNLESLATLLIAWVIFHEYVDTRLLIGGATILIGAGILSWQGSSGTLSWSALAIVGACIAWAIDNNLTRKIAGGDPVQIAMAKGLAAGAVNLTLAFANDAALPGASILVSAAVIGFFGYGLSLVLFVLALRHLGTARTGAYFATAPFIGVMIAIVVLAEPISARLVAAALLMAFGLWLHLTENHEHRHEHIAEDHEHPHSHDVHHEHEHGLGDAPGEPHTHRHIHKPVLHAHPHYPDLHHQHRH